MEAFFVIPLTKCLLCVDLRGGGFLQEDKTLRRKAVRDMTEQKSENCSWLCSWGHKSRGFCSSLQWCITWTTRAGDSWHSSKIIRADEKNTGII
jgi:hypothetical protein